MSLLSAQLPIESHLAALLVDRLNAEVISGGVRTVDEALYGSRRRAASSARFSRSVSRRRGGRDRSGPYARRSPHGDHRTDVRPMLVLAHLLDLDAQVADAVPGLKDSSRCASGLRIGRGRPSAYCTKLSNATRPMNLRKYVDVLTPALVCNSLSRFKVRRARPPNPCAPGRQL